MLSEDQDDLRRRVRDFIAREVDPHASEWGERRTVPTALHRAAGQAGLLGLKYQREWGGLERPYEHTLIMLEEFGRSGHMGALLSLALQSEFATPHIWLHGTAAQKARWLAPAIAGSCIVAVAMTEPDGGSDLAHLRTIATPTEGGYVVSGRKWMVGNGSLADVILVVCREAGSLNESGLARSSLVAVEAGTPGFSVVRTIEKTGLHATPNCELSFDDCFVSHDAVIGRPGLALPQGIVANAYERVALSAIAMGAAREGLESAVEFLSSRGKADSPLLERSPWRHALTDEWLRLEGAERIVRDASLGLSAGRPDPALVLMAKIAATEACRHALNLAAQAHGARGFLAEERIGRLAADARALTIGGGATEALVDALSRLVFPRIVRARRTAS